MTPDSTQFLDAFPSWLKRLPEDVRALATALSEAPPNSATARSLACALNYLFRSLDLIPDGIEDLGFVDDAFVLRVAVAELGEGEGGSSHPAIAGLRDEAQVIRTFLAADYARLQAYVAGLESVTVRGRSVDAIVSEPDVRREFVAELRSWAESFEPPSFGRDVHNLTKLKAFLHVKLPKLA